MSQYKLNPCPGLKGQSVRVSEQNLLVENSNPTQTFYSHFKESFSGEYHIIPYVPFVSLHSCDCLNKISKF